MTLSEMRVCVGGDKSEVSSLRSLKLCCAKVVQTAPLHLLTYIPFTEIQPNVLYCNCADKCEVRLWMCYIQDQKLTVDKQPMQVGNKCYNLLTSVLTITL